MAHLAGGRFFGWREYEVAGKAAIYPPPVVGPPALIMAKRPERPARYGLQPWEIDLLSSFFYDYKSFRGTAGDTFEFLDVGFTSQLVVVSVRDHPIQIVVYGPSIERAAARTFYHPAMMLESVSSFAVRSAVAGDNARWQMVFYR